MKSAIVVGTAGVALSFVMLAVGFVAGSRRVAPPQPQPQQMASLIGDRAQIEQIVHDYLINNPQVMVDVQAALDAKQRADEQVAQKDAIRKDSNEIYHSADDGIIGNPNGKETIVEFFDYNCHYCRGALSDMSTLVKDNPNLRFVMKEFPILGPDSQRASVVSLAFHEMMPQKYGEFHVKLLGSPGLATEEAAIKIAVSLGADEFDAAREDERPGDRQAGERQLRSRQASRHHRHAFIRHRRPGGLRRDGPRRACPESRRRPRLPQRNVLIPRSRLSGLQRVQEVLCALSVATDADYRGADVPDLAGASGKEACPRPSMFSTDRT